MNRILSFLGFFSLIFYGLTIAVEEAAPMRGQTDDQETTIITEKRDVGAFRSLRSELAHANVFVTRGLAFSVTLKGHKDDLKNIKTVVDGTTLVISGVDSRGVEHAISIDGQDYTCGGRLNISDAGVMCCYDEECESLTPTQGRIGEVEIHIKVPLRSFSSSGAGNIHINL